LLERLLLAVSCLLSFRKSINLSVRY